MQLKCNHQNSIYLMILFVLWLLQSISAFAVLHMDVAYAVAGDYFFCSISLLLLFFALCEMPFFGAHLRTIFFSSCKRTRKIRKVGDDMQRANTHTHTLYSRALDAQVCAE